MTLSRSSQHVGPLTLARTEGAIARLVSRPARYRSLERAFHEFAPVTTLDSFELHWFEAAAVLKGDAGLVS